MPSLYELTGERLALQHKLEELDFDQQTIEDTLEGESTALQEKIESYGVVIRNMEAFTELMKAEEDRMANRRKAHEKRVAAIKEWLLTNMQACQISKIECPAFTVSLKNNPAKVVIDNEGLIPDDYMRLPEPPQPAPNKTMIATAIKSGMEVPGCHLESSQRIEIK